MERGVIGSSTFALQELPHCHGHCCYSRWGHVDVPQVCFKNVSKGKLVDRRNKDVGGNSKMFDVD